MVEGRPRDHNPALPAMTASTMDRASDLARSALRLPAAMVGKSGKVLISGAGLKYGAGPVAVTSVGIAGGALDALRRKQPFILVAGSTDGLSEALGVDRAERLDGLISPVAGIILFAGSDGRAVVAHLAADAPSAERLKRHDAALRWVSAHQADTAWGRLAAEPVAFRETADHTVFVQSRLPGRAVEFSRLDDNAVLDLLRVACEPLLSVHRAARRLGQTVDFRPMLERFSELPKIYPQAQAELAPALAALRAWAGERVLPAVPVHGDYKIGNLLFADQPRRLSGIVDWDNFRPAGLPLIDGLNLMVNLRATRDGVHYGTALTECWDLESRTPLVSAYLDHLLGETAVTEEDMRHIAMALWLRYLWEAEADRQPIDAAWIDAMVQPPAAAIAASLSRPQGGARTVR